MPTELNISLSSDAESPTIKFILTDEHAATLSGSATDTASNIKFVATGADGLQGEKGDAGTPDIGTGEIVNTMIADGSITDSKLATDSVTTSKIGNSTITSDKINNLAVTTAKIAENAITASKIAPGVVTNELLSDGIITANKIGDLTITGEKLSNGIVTAVKLASSSVTEQKIADSAITGAKVANNIELNGAKVRGNFQLLGDSPAYITVPNLDELHLQSERDLIFRVDSNNQVASSFIFKNGTGGNVATLDEDGNLSVTGNISVTGTVDGRDISSLPATDTNTTYNISCLDAGTASEKTIRLTDSGGANDDITLESGTGLSISRVGDKITLTNTVTDTDTVLTAEQVQDIVGAMFTGNTETRVSATYDDSDGTIDLVVDDMTTDTNTQLTDEQVQDIVGAMVDGGTETNISVTYDDTSGKLNFVSTDTNTTYSSMGSGNSYAAGLTPAGSGTHGDTYLRKDGTWATPTDTNTTYSEATSSDAGLMSTAHHDKLDGIATGAEVNVNADWNSSSGDSEILNKPTIPADLETDGAGTIHTNNVPTLNQDTTGNAATADALTSGNKSLSGSFQSKGLIVDGNVTFTPGEGGAIHVDTADMTDSTTSASGTAVMYSHVSIENPRVIATNSNVTTTNACTLYIKGAPVVGTNMTFTNSWALYISGGDSYFANVNVNDLTVRGNDIKDDDGTTCITFDSSGNTTIANTLNASLTGNVTGNVSGSSGSCTGNAATATTATTATNLVASTSTAVELGTIELGHASDTTIHRTHAGRVAIEGNEIQTTNKHKHFINFGVNLMYNYARYIPIGSYYIYEQNTDSNPEYTTYVAPHDGKFIKALVRSEESLANTTLTIYKVGDGTEEPDQGSTVDTKTVDIASANTSYTYTFDSDATFSAGDALSIKIQPTTDPTAAGVVGTFCLEFDLTT